MLTSRYQDGQLRQIIMKLDSFSQSMAFPEIWLSHLADAYELAPDTTLSDLDWTDILLQDARIQVASCSMLCSHMPPSSRNTLSH